MHFKKAFTLIEIIVVIIIMSLIMYSNSKLFSNKDIDKVRFDTCYIHSYSNMNSFFQKAILQKMIFTGGNYKPVLDYRIKFDVNNQFLELLYSGTSYSYKINYFGITEDKEHSCYSKTYYTKLSGDNLEIIIQPGLQSNNNKFPIQIIKNGTLINNVANASGEVYFYKCNRKNFCEQRYRIELIPKAYLIKSYYCKKLNSGNGSCVNWSK